LSASRSAGLPTSTTTRGYAPPRRGHSAPDRDPDRDADHDHDHGHDHEHDRGPDHDRDRGRDRNHDRDPDRDPDHDHDHGHDHDHDRGPDHDRDRGVAPASSVTTSARREGADGSRVQRPRSRLGRRCTPRGRALPRTACRWTTRC
jgi:hypothetical protein